jgi:hypothetical protein
MKTISNENSSLNYYTKKNANLKDIHSIIGLIGIIFNILSICVFSRNQLIKHSYSIYWKTKACFDIILLLYSLHPWVEYFLGFDPQLISLFFCRFTEYHVYIASGVSLWLECLIALDRVFNIVYPNRFAFTKQKPFQFVIFIVILFYNVLIHIQIPLNFELIWSNGSWICYISIDILKINWIIGIYHVLVVNLLVIPLLDLRIMCHIVRSRGHVRRRQPHTAIIDRKFAIRAFWINTTNLILRLPFLIAALLLMFIDSLRINGDIDTLYSISLFLTLLDHVNIFFINFSVNSIFRREFLTMIGFKKPKPSNSR